MTAFAPILATSFALAGMAVAARTGNLGVPKRPTKRDEPTVQYQIVAGDAIAVAQTAAVQTAEQPEPPPEATVAAVATVTMEDPNTIEGVAIESPPDATPKRAPFWKRGWFSVFQLSIKHDSTQETLLDQLAADTADVGTGDAIAVTPHATLEDTQLLENVRLDPNNLVEETPPPMDPPNPATMVQAESDQRQALEDAAELQLQEAKAQEARDNEARLLADAKARAENNRWYIRLDPDLAPEDVDGRIAITKDLVSLRNVTWAQRLLEDALDKEPEGRVRARIYGVLARIGGAEDRRGLYEASAARGDEDKEAVIDAVASAAPSWAMEFLSSIA